MLQYLFNTKITVKSRSTPERHLNLYIDRHHLQACTSSCTHVNTNTVTWENLIVKWAIYQVKSLTLWTAQWTQSTSKFLLSLAWKPTCNVTCQYGRFRRWTQSKYAWILHLFNHIHAFDSMLHSFCSLIFCLEITCTCIPFQSCYFQLAHWASKLLFSFPQGWTNKIYLPRVIGLGYILIFPSTLSRHLCQVLNRVSVCRSLIALPNYPPSLL